MAPLTGARAATPELYRMGDTFASFTTKDQHEKSYTFDRGVRVAIVSFEMGTGKSANAFFEKQPASFLDPHHAIFVSNIHGMPGIGRMFALPKMKKYPHRILLADAPDFLDRCPVKDDQIPCLRLSALPRLVFFDAESDFDFRSQTLASQGL